MCVSVYDVQMYVGCMVLSQIASYGPLLIVLFAIRQMHVSNKTSLDMYTLRRLRDPQTLVYQVN